MPNQATPAEKWILLALINARGYVPDAVDKAGVKKRRIFYVKSKYIEFVTAQICTKEAQEYTSVI